jgi:hypothetical protein
MLQILLWNGLIHYIFIIEHRDFSILLKDGTRHPIAQEIMALMATPQSMQQVVILSEIFHRPKFER